MNLRNAKRIAFSLAALGGAAWFSLRTVPEPEHKMRTEVVQVVVDDATVQGTDAFALIEPVWDRVDIYGSVPEYRRTLAPFSDAQRYLFAIHWYRSEVNNGGHDQFFYNSTGIVWPDAVAGLEAIGVAEFASILKEAAGRLQEPSQDRDQRQAQLEAFKGDFEDLDDRFFALEETTNLDERMLEFARKRPSDFYFTGTVERPVFPGSEK